MWKPACNWIFVLCLGAMLCACSSSDSTSAPRLSGDGLPSLYSEKEAATLTGFTILGAETFERSGQCQDLAEGTLQLTFYEAGLTYALYRFNQGGDWPGQFSVYVETPDAPYYVALPDYAAGHWSLAGPFTGKAQLELDPASSYSPAHNIYCAVLPSTTAALSIKQLEISLDLPDASPRLLASLTATPDEGDAPMKVTLDASGSQDIDGGPLSYEWDGDGDGKFELDLGELPVTVANIVEPGEYSFSVRVRNADGLSATASVAITAHGWARVPIKVRSTYGVAACSPSLALVDGRPAIAYIDGDVANYSRIKYAIASTALGTHAEDWKADIGLPGSTKSHNPALLVVQGNPAVAFEDRTSSRICYARASTPEGEYSMDWSSPVIVDNSADAKGPPSLALIGGRPAAAYVVYSEATDEWDLKYAWSATDKGELTADWSSVYADAEAGTWPSNPSLCEIEGRAAIAYQAGSADSVLYSSLRYTICSLIGTATEDSWIDRVLEEDFYVGGFPTLLIWQGGPAVVYHDSQGDDNGLRFIRALSADGALAGDWLAPLVIDHDPSRSTGAFACATLVKGQLAVAQNSWNGNADRLLRYTCVNSGTGDLASDWNNAMVFTDMQVDTTQAIADINGHVAIAFCDHPANGGLDLWYCIRF